MYRSRSMWPPILPAPLPDVLRYQLPSKSAARACCRRAACSGFYFFSGIGVLCGTATAVTLFWGEPSITRSE